MPIVSWIEDKANLLEDARVELADLKGVDKVAIYPDATAAVRALDRIRADGGPVVLDLSIPPVPNHCPDLGSTAGHIGTPEIGLRLLHFLRRSSGRDSRCFIISGNLKLETVEHILEQELVPREAMFTKPLTTKKIDRFLKLVAQDDTNPWSWR